MPHNTRTVRTALAQLAYTLDILFDQDCDIDIAGSPDLIADIDRIEALVTDALDDQGTDDDAYMPIRLGRVGMSAL